MALILAGQIALLFLFSEKTPARVVAPTDGVRITLILDPVVNRQVLETLGASDPTLFALVNPKSFSGKGWLNVLPRQHRLQDWAEPDFVLSPSAPVAGGMFASFLRTNLFALEVGGEKLSPEIRSLARPLLSLPLLTTNLSPPEVTRPQVARVRNVPVWSTADAREPLVWLRLQFTSPGDAWSALVATNAVGAPPHPQVAPAPTPVKTHPVILPPAGVKLTNAPRSQLGPPVSSRAPSVPPGS